MIPRLPSQTFSAFEMEDVRGRGGSAAELALRPASHPPSSQRLRFAVSKLQLIVYGSGDACLLQRDAMWQAVEGQQVTLQDVVGSLNKLSIPIAASIAVGFDSSCVAVPMQQTVAGLLLATRKCRIQFQFEFDGHEFWLWVSGEERAAIQIRQFWQHVIPALYISFLRIEISITDDAGSWIALFSPAVGRCPIPRDEMALILIICGVRRLLATVAHPPTVTVKLLWMSRPLYAGMLDSKFSIASVLDIVSIATGPLRKSVPVGIMDTSGRMLPRNGILEKCAWHEPLMLVWNLQAHHCTLMQPAAPKI